MPDVDPSDFDTRYSELRALLPTPIPVPRHFPSGNVLPRRHCLPGLSRSAKATTVLTRRFQSSQPSHRRFAAFLAHTPFVMGRPDFARADALNRSREERPFGDYEFGGLAITAGLRGTFRYWG